MGKNYLKVNDLKGLISSLAMSQGFYGRLYRDVEESKSRKKLEKFCAKNNICNGLDFILAIEG